MNCKSVLKHERKKLGAVLVALAFGGLTTPLSIAQEQDEEEAIDEVVAVGTRLKGTAAAVLQERQNQAFVADILGAEQISRTGDGDAAAALRRVTGLTLLDGKYIYVRGLGERYSSTQLNGMGVPSPDPTRSVVPLDLFPSDIIESLNVQKSFSPNMPAHFGGGNVNIRTKSIPTDEVFKVSAGTGWSTNNSNDGYFYSGGGDDWSGRDDGTRSLPDIIANSLEQAQGDAGIEGSTRFPLTLDDRKAMLQAMNWDIGPDKKSANPDMSIGATYGNVFDNLPFGEEWGFLSTFSYDNKWNIAEESTGTSLGTVGCSDQFPDSDNDKCFGQSFSGVTTKQNVTWSGMFNVGFKYNSDHRIELTNVILHDMSDRVRNRSFIDVNETAVGEKEFSRVDVLFEERRMTSNQIKGTHNFTEYNQLYLDWYAGTSRASRNAPGALDVVFQHNFDNGTLTSSQLQDIAATNVVREYETLKDISDTWGWNAGMPFFGQGWELELKAGADFFEKARTASSVTIEVPHRAIADAATFGDRIDGIFSLSALASDEFYNSATGAGILESGTADGDKYAAGTMMDAYYFMADAFIDNTWRISGGVRYEDFRQVSVPFGAHQNTFSVEGDELASLAFNEDDVFPSLAVTYMAGEHQFRFNLSETAIRPDMRDISTSFFIDPITEFLVRGTPLLRSSKLKNFDFRWEWYMESGNNLSAAIFYKDITNPIELVELGTVGGAEPNLLTANGEEGELYGLEVEFLQDLGFLGDYMQNFFLSGNVTLSDSEVTIGAVDDDVTTLFETQLLDALDATSASNIVTNNVRRLVGHSEWVGNIQLGWDSEDGEHAANLVYNVFGPRIIVPGTRGNEDAEEKPYHSLDFVYSYYPNFNTTIKAKIGNILGEDKIIEQEGLNLQKQERGTTFSLSVSYDFN